MRLMLKKISVLESLGRGFKAYPKLLALIMAAVLVVPLSTPVLAAESNEIDYKESDVLTYEYYQEVSKIAQARGITLLPYDKITESNVSSFMQNATRDVGGGVSQEDAAVISVNGCCFGNIDEPYKEEWFKFEVNGNGAHNLYTTGQTDTKVELYKRTWYGSYTLIASNDDAGGGNLNFRLELGLNMNVDYYVKVTAYSNTTGGYCMWLNENKDSINAPDGGSWTWDVANPDPDGAYFNIDKITYLSPENAQGYYIMVSNDSYRSIRDTILNISFDAAVALIMSEYKVAEGVAGFIVATSASYSFPSLTDLELDSIAEAGGLKSNGKFSNGIVIKSVTTYSAQSIPVMLNTYESWTSSYMYGAPRYRGTFDLTDIKPLWR